MRSLLNIFAWGFGVAFTAQNAFANSSVPEIFSTRTILEVQMTAPWAKLFRAKAQAKKGTKDPGLPIEIRYFNGAQTQVIMGNVRVRGNTSVTECKFPKLKIKIPKEGSLNKFLGVDGFKLNTHCGDGGELSHLGRLYDQKATLREGLAYELGTSLGLAMGLIRRLKVTYVDSGRKNAKTLVRYALLIEDPDETAKRHDGKRWKEERYPHDPVKTMGWGELALVYLFENLVGNWDFHLYLKPKGNVSLGSVEKDRFEKERLWNMGVSVHNVSPWERAMPEDFDMASLVTGNRPLSGNLRNTEFLQTENDLTRYLAFEILKSRSFIPRQHLLPVAEQIINKQKQLEALALEPFLDPDGVKNAIEHIRTTIGLLKTILQTPIVTEDVIGVDVPGTGNMNCRLQAGSPLKIIGEDGEWTKVQNLGLGNCGADSWVPKKLVERP